MEMCAYIILCFIYTFTHHKSTIFNFVPITVENPMFSRLPCPFSVGCLIFCQCSSSVQSSIRTMCCVSYLVYGLRQLLSPTELFFPQQKFLPESLLPELISFQFELCSFCMSSHLGSYCLNLQNLSTRLFQEALVFYFCWMKAYDMWLLFPEESQNILIIFSRETRKQKWTKMLWMAHTAGGYLLPYLQGWIARASIFCLT